MLKLNKDQKNAAKEIFDAAQKEATPVRAGIQKSRGDIAIALLAKKDPPEIDQLLTNYGDFMAQMAGIELRALTGVLEKLNPDQQRRAGEAFLLMPGMFSKGNWI